MPSTTTTTTTTTPIHLTPTILLHKKIYLPHSLHSENPLTSLNAHLPSTQVDENNLPSFPTSTPSCNINHPRGSSLASPLIPRRARTVRLRPPHPHLRPRSTVLFGLRREVGPLILVHILLGLRREEPLPLARCVALLLVRRQWGGGLLCYFLFRERGQVSFAATAAEEEPEDQAEENDQDRNDAEKELGVDVDIEEPRMEMGIIGHG